MSLTKRLLNTSLSALVTFSMVLTMACPTAALAFDDDSAPSDEVVSSEIIPIEGEGEEPPAEGPTTDPSIVPTDEPTDGEGGEQDPEEGTGEQVSDDQTPTDEVIPTEETTPAEETTEVDSSADAQQDEDAVSTEKTPEDKKKDEVTVKPQATAPAEVAPVISYQAHVQNIGWQKAVQSGKTAGTSGKSLRVEALKIQLLNDKGTRVKGIRYRSHVQNIGWQDWVKDGALTGTSGKSLRVEALQIELYGSLAEKYDVYYRVHVQNHGWLGWAKNGECSGSSCYSQRIEAIQIVLTKSGAKAPSSKGSVTTEAYLDGSSVAIRAHVQNIGWQSRKERGAIVGSTGKGYRLEAFDAILTGYLVDGGVQYSAHVQNIGWQGWRSDGKVAGTTGKGYRVEAVKFRLTGDMADFYDIYYRVHVQSYGWLAWTKNGNPAGSEGLSARIEAMQVKVVKKDASDAPKTGGISFLTPLSITYAADVEGYDWRLAKQDGETVGAAGGSRALEQFWAKLILPENGTFSGNVTYAAHVSGVGWMKSVSDGTYAGMDVTKKGKVTSKDKGIEAVKIKLSGSIADYYDVYYRVYVDGLGWLGWAKNGSAAGSTGYGLPIRGMQIRLTGKGIAPGDTTIPFIDTGRHCIGQLYRDANATQRKMVSAANKVPTPGGGLCAAWVTMVGERAGIGTHDGDACDLYYDYCFTSDKSQLKVGMIVAVGRHNRTYAGSIYGHVGIYVGDGWIMDNVGYIRRVRLNDWIDYYGAVMPVKWGWLGNRKLG